MYTKIEKLMKKMGLDLKKIENKKIRNELLALIMLYLSPYQICGKPYKKDIMTNVRTIPLCELTKEKLFEIASDPSYIKEIVDENKTRTIVEGYKVQDARNGLNGPEYNFEVIYDKENNIYTIEGYPLVQESFSHHNFNGGFYIEYDPKAERIFGQTYEKTLDYKLKVSKHKYDYIYDSLLLTSREDFYEASSVIRMEGKYTRSICYRYKLSDIYRNIDREFSCNQLSLQFERLSFASREKCVVGINHQGPNFFGIDRVENGVNIYSYVPGELYGDSEKTYNDSEKYEFSQNNKSTLLVNEMIYMKEYISSRIHNKKRIKSKK